MALYVHPGRTTALRRFWDGTLLDRCRIAVYSSTPDAFNNETASYAVGGETACMFNPTETREVQEGGMVIITEAQLRIPGDTVIAGNDRILITQRNGTAISPAPNYEIVGEPKLTLAGLVLDLVLVTDGSDVDS